MSGYFKAEPYPDEEICSLLIRTVRRIGLSSPDFVRWYFNLPPAPLTSIGNLIPHIAELVGCTPRRILQEHTLVPYGTAALPPAESRRFTIDLTSGRIPELSNPIGKLGLRWCEACVHFELGKFGESYWHRSHLLPGLPRIQSRQSRKWSRSGWTRHSHTNCLALLCVSQLRTVYYTKLARCLIVHSTGDVPCRMHIQ